MLFYDFFVTIPDFVLDKGRFVTVIYDETEIFVIKVIFYDGFGFVIKIFVIEVDIPSSAWILCQKVHQRLDHIEEFP